MTELFQLLKNHVLLIIFFSQRPFSFSFLMLSSRVWIRPTSTHVVHLRPPNIINVATSRKLFSVQENCKITRVCPLPSTTKYFHNLCLKLRFKIKRWHKQINDKSEKRQKYKEYLNGFNLWKIKELLIFPTFRNLFIHTGR
jgi:hypothetical protein